MDRKSITVDIDLSGLPTPEALVAACESEDEIGCVLRMHFLVEKVVDFYFDTFASSDIRAFVQPVWEFRHKLDRAVIIGLPLPFAHASKMLAKIRNDAAHGEPKINRGHLDNLIHRVDALSVLDGGFVPVNKRWIKFPVSMPGETITLKSHSTRLDFILTSVVLYTEVHKWVASEAMKRAAIAQHGAE